MLEAAMTVTFAGAAVGVWAGVAATMHAIWYAA